MPDPTPERRIVLGDDSVCACCGEMKTSLEEYTGVTGGPICSDCHHEWLEGQRENPEW